MELSVAGGDEVPARAIGVPAHWTRQGVPAEPVLRAALRGKDDRPLRRHQPIQGEGGVCGEHRAGPCHAWGEVAAPCTPTNYLMVLGCYLVKEL